MLMGRSSRTYSIFHILMRYDAIFLDYSGVARSVAKVCGFQQSHKLTHCNVTITECWHRSILLRRGVSLASKFPREMLSWLNQTPPMIVCASSHVYHFPAEIASSSEEETNLILETIKMAENRKEKVLKALCVLITHIVVIISWLRGSPLARKWRKIPRLRAY